MTDGVTRVTGELSSEGVRCSRAVTLLDGSGAGPPHGASATRRPRLPRFGAMPTVVSASVRGFLNSCARLRTAAGLRVLQLLQPELHRNLGGLMRWVWSRVAAAIA